MKHKLLAATLAMGFTGITYASDIADFFSQMQTFKGNFSQTVYQDGALVQQSKGKVALKKPLKFRWDYQSPEPMQLISDGQRFYHYDIDLAQVTSKPIDEIAGTALASLLKDSHKIDETFNTFPLSTAALSKEFPQYAKKWKRKASKFYDLKPTVFKPDDIQTARLLIGFSKNNRLTVFYAEDAYGQNAFVFDHVQQNTPISDKTFQFVAPAGVDVLGDGL